MSFISKIIAILYFVDPRDSSVLDGLADVRLSKDEVKRTRVKIGIATKRHYRNNPVNFAISLVKNSINLVKFLLLREDSCSDLSGAKNGTECKAPSVYEKLIRSLSKEFDKVEKCLQACEEHVDILGYSGCCEYDTDHNWCGFYHNGIVFQTGESGFKAVSCSTNHTKGIELYINVKCTLSVTCIIVKIVIYYDDQVLLMGKWI